MPLPDHTRSEQKWTLQGSGGTLVNHLAVLYMAASPTPQPKTREIPLLFTGCGPNVQKEKGFGNRDRPAVM